MRCAGCPFFTRAQDSNKYCGADPCDKTGKIE